MIKDNDKTRRKRQRIINLVKVFVYIVVGLIYYIFFQIMLMFVNLYTEKYKKDVNVVYNQLLTEKENMEILNKDIKKNKKNFFSLVLELNKKNNQIKNEQSKILEHMNNMLKKDIIAYGYYCTDINNKIIKNKKDFLINFNNIDLSKYNILVKTKIKKKLNGIEDGQQELIDKINKFYLLNCNQNTWFRKLVKKYFE